MNKKTTKRLLILFCTLTIFWCNNLKAQCNILIIPNVNFPGACNGGASIMPIGGVPPYTYIWTGPPGFTATTSAVYGLCDTTYTVIVIDAIGDTICNDSIIIQSLLPIIVTLTTIPSSLGVCNGILIANVSGGIPPYSYLWMVNYTFISAPTLIPVFTGLCPGDTCCVTVTDSLGCTFTDCQIIPGIISNIENPSKDIKKTILKITNILGQPTEIIKNKPLLYIYNDGTIEKKIIIE